MTFDRKPYSAMKNSGLPWLGKVPDHWDMERAKWLFRRMERPVRESDEVVTCFRDGAVTLRKNRRTRGFTPSLKEIGYQGIRRGDLVIHAMDAFAGAVGVADSDGKGTPVYSVCQPASNANAYCPRSVMLYLIYQRNHPDLDYRGGQGPIVHLEADLHESVAWAEENQRRWAFTLSNAGSYFFEDRADVAALDEIDWKAVRATDWRAHKDGKQAEFLMETSFPWVLIERIGVHSATVYRQAVNALAKGSHKPRVEVKSDWYY